MSNSLIVGILLSAEFEQNHAAMGSLLGYIASQGLNSEV